MVKLSWRMLFLGAIAMGLSLSCMSDRGASPDALAQKTLEAKTTAEEVLPNEDLMREHGVLRRILLIYQEASNRLDTDQPLDLGVITEAAGIVQKFIENYHEKLEEQYLFPAFEKAQKQTALVEVLRTQHQAGRRLTAEILASKPKTLEDRQALSLTLQQFKRMYEPHAAREDTVLFPAFRGIITPEQYSAYGDLFEDKEHELFGDRGFERIVEQVASLEKRLGIYDLRLFTP